MYLIGRFRCRFCDLVTDFCVRVDEEPQDGQFVTVHCGEDNQPYRIVLKQLKTVELPPSGVHFLKAAPKTSDPSDE